MRDIRNVKYSRTYKFSEDFLNELIKQNPNIDLNYFISPSVEVISYSDFLSKDVDNRIKNHGVFIRTVTENIAVDDKLVLITVHRRENHGERIDRILDAIESLVKSYPDHRFVLPVHPNPNVKCKVYSRLGEYENVHLLKPLDYPYLVYLMKNAKLILTDSGGIQEEAPSFGCPTLVMRYETERQEGVDAGVSVLVGADYEKIVSLSSEILSKDRAQTRLTAQNPYGVGNSAQTIRQIIDGYFAD